MLVPILLNLLVLEVRAAFLMLPLGIALVLGFKFGVRRILYLVVGGAVIIGLLYQFVPDDVVASISDRMQPVAQVDTAMTTISDRMRPVVQFDDSGDSSVYGRLDAMKEGLAVGLRNWLFGIGPGAALTQHSQTSAHQLFVQQFMETGVLGLVGSIVFSCAMLVILLRTYARGQDGGPNNMRFTLIIGPACFILYGIVANDTFNIGYFNPWTVLVVSMLALTPRFDKRSRDRAMTKVSAVAGRQMQDG
jgi:O-antigen ligase